MNDPEISIVVPIYKINEIMLRKCIESCINQTKHNIEIVLVDDYSCDISSDICDEYQKHDPRIVVIHKEKNQGLSAARNTGVCVATGVWILFVDGDDWIEEDICELIDGESDKDLVFFGMRRDYENRSKELVMPYHDGQYFNEEECKYLQEDILDYHKRLSTVYCKFVKKSVLEENDMYHNASIRCGIEGIEYNLRLFGVIKSAIFKKKYKYHYVFNPNSITGAPSEKTNMYILKGLECIKSYIDSMDDNLILTERMEQRAQRILLDTAIGSYFNPNYKLKYIERKSKMKYFLKNDIIRSIVHKKTYYENNHVKRLIFFCVIHEVYPALSVFGLLRKVYLQLK